MLSFSMITMKSREWHKALSRNCHFLTKIMRILLEWTCWYSCHLSLSTQNLSSSEKLLQISFQLICNRVLEGVLLILNKRKCKLQLKKNSQKTIWFLDSHIIFKMQEMFIFLKGLKGIKRRYLKVFAKVYKLWNKLK